MWVGGKKFKTAMPDYAQAEIGLEPKWRRTVIAVFSVCIYICTILEAVPLETLGALGAPRPKCVGQSQRRPNGAKHAHIYRTRNI